MTVTITKLSKTWKVVIIRTFASWLDVTAWLTYKNNWLGIQFNWCSSNFQTGVIPQKTRKLVDPWRKLTFKKYSHLSLNSRECRHWWSMLSRMGPENTKYYVKVHLKLLRSYFQKCQIITKMPMNTTRNKGTDCWHLPPSKSFTASLQKLRIKINKDSSPSKILLSVVSLSAALLWNLIHWRISRTCKRQNTNCLSSQETTF